MSNLLLTAAIVLLAAAGSSAQWTRANLSSSESFRGISVVNERVVWASGTAGTIVRSIDGGKTWKVIKVPAADKLDFRDIEAFDANTAYVLSIGNGESSRIYKTTDGGATWNEQFRNANEKAFFDAIACWDRLNCIAMSDPVEGHYLLISTTNGGKNWGRVVSNNMPAAKDGEAAFAASGTCLVTVGKTEVYLVSGGSDARVFRSQDRGVNWMVTNTPIVKGTPGSGIFSIAFSPAKSAVIVGGNYEKPNETSGTLALSSDHAQTWAPGSGLNGYRSGVAFIDARSLVAVGTNGSDVSTDGGKTWRALDKENYNAVAARGRRAVWAVGPKGLISRLTGF